MTLFDSLSTLVKDYNKKITSMAKVRIIDNKEAWERYNEELHKHIAYFELSRPQQDDPNSKTQVEYERAYNEWEMARFCDAPNPPGSEFSNND